MYYIPPTLYPRAGLEGRVYPWISLMYYIPPTLYPTAGLEGRVIISLDKPNVLYTSYFIS